MPGAWTGFGISTAYQAAALDLNGTGGLISLDVGDITKLAQPGLERLGSAAGSNWCPA